MNRKSRYSGLIVSPDSELFNSKTIRYILRETYRKNRTVIGFTPSLTTIGAIGSVFYSDDIVVESIFAAISSYSSHGKLPVSFYPDQSQISLNYDVARSLGLDLSAIEEAKAEGQK